MDASNDDTQKRQGRGRINPTPTRQSRKITLHTEKIDKSRADLRQSLMGDADTEISKSNQEALREKLVTDFAAHNLPTDAVQKAATYLARQFMLEKCVAAWEKIPTIQDAKAEAKAKGIKWDMSALEYFDAHWRFYLDAGYLYQHHLREYDPTLLSNMRSHCHNHNIVFEQSEWWLPTISKYQSDLAPIADSLMGEEAAAYFGTQRSRVSREAAI
ncbi:MAG: hypothetical protein AAF986_08425 [Pseudomonadota bacterium]